LIIEQRNCRAVKPAPLEHRATELRGFRQPYEKPIFGEKEMQTQTNNSILQRVFWRLHFWAGLLTAPIIIFAALTGLLYVFTPQIEAWRHAELDTVNTVAPHQNLDAQIAAVRMQFPNDALRTIIPAVSNTQTAQFVFGDKKKRATNKSIETEKVIEIHNTEHQHHTQAARSDRPFIAYINPGTLALQGTIAEDGRFKEWASKLHSSVLQGDGWRWLIELGASWMIMMLLTGIYLWWPRGKANWYSVLRWNRSQNQRANWRYFHSISSIVFSVLTLTILLTGITWSKYAGENFRAMQAALKQSSPKVPKELQSAFTPGVQALSAETIYRKALQLAPEIQMQLTPPRSERGAWRIESFDRTQPQKRFQLVLDAYTGAVLYQSGWDNLPLLAQATAIGIPFHRGEFGWWNQALLILVALSTIFSVVSGYVMWLQRRKAGSLSAPAIDRRHALAIPWWMYFILIMLGYALPVFGISLVLLLIFEVVTMFLGHKKNQT
jgi:uncharacterized iron-regulated membrane protein